MGVSTKDQLEQATEKQDKMIEVYKLLNSEKLGVVIGIITGWDISEEEARQKGVDFLINKPFHADYLLQTVTNAVKSKAG